MQQNEIVSLDRKRVLVRRDGYEAGIEDSAAPIHDRHGRVVGAVLVFHDVSASRAPALKMSHQAQHDFLTGLPNRLLLTDRLTQAIALVAVTATKSPCCFWIWIFLNASTTPWVM